MPLDVNYGVMIELLRFVKFCHTIGIYEQVCGGITEITEEDNLELFQRGLESVAPIYIFNQVTDGEDGPIFLYDETGDEQVEEDGEYHWHDYHTFGSPAMQEYYRLCRLYEEKEGIQPEENPFKKEAEAYAIYRVSVTNGQFGAGFDDDVYPSKLFIEICPESYWPLPDLVYCVHDILYYYEANLKELELKIQRGSVIPLADLPMKGGRAA